MPSTSTRIGRLARTGLLVALTAAVVPAEAMPIARVADGDAAALTPVADGCGPGLVRGRRGTCLSRRAIFSRGRIVRKGCGKPIGAGLRTPC